MQLETLPQATLVCHCHSLKLCIMHWMIELQFLFFKLRTITQAFRIGAAGRLAAEKGFDRLILAFANLKCSIPDAEFAHCGTGSKLKSLEALCNEKRVESRYRCFFFEAHCKIWPSSTLV